MPVAGAAEHTVVHSVRSSTNTFKKHWKAGGCCGVCKHKIKDSKAEEKEGLSIQHGSSHLCRSLCKRVHFQQCPSSQKDWGNHVNEIPVVIITANSYLVCPSSPSHKSNSQTDEKQEHKRGHVAVSAVHQIKAVIHTKELDVVCSTPNNKLQSKTTTTEKHCKQTMSDWCWIFLIFPPFWTL